MSSTEFANMVDWRWLPGDDSEVTRTYLDSYPADVDIVEEDPDEYI